MRALGLPTVAWGIAPLVYGLTCPLAEDEGLGARLVCSAVVVTAGTGLVLRMRQRLLRQPRRARRTDRAVPDAPLRPPPTRVDGLDVAAAQLCADRGTVLGGDLYDVVGTEHGVRVVIGDARGHGLAARATAAAVRGGFRAAAHDEKDLADVLRRLERALARHLRERPFDDTAAEEFVTVLLLEIGVDGDVRALNCGHPWPYLISGTDIVPLARAGPLPPLGALPLPGEIPALHFRHLLPGEALFLHTDGAKDVRDARGRFFPLRQVLAEAVGDQPLCARDLLRRTLAALLRHTDGPPDDDVSLLVLQKENAPFGIRTLAHPFVPASRP
ncbi:PP2C family protein-serine/threonine phosphatase [Streptomyces fumanus]|uniref:PP2C family protein-serine/threonine phosphatase n=1 Tax=Streptomyces fumanus TaxID=67302 RepID=UPI00340DE153